MTTPNVTAAPVCGTPALADLRKQIDAIDSELLQLLNRRALIAEQVGEVKKREGTPFFRPDRIAQVIATIQQANPGPLKDPHVTAIWREIMSACLALEAPQRVAILGPEGTFCEQAAMQYFGTAAEFVYCHNFDEVFEATTAGRAQFGVVGVENSTEGVVTRTLDLFLHTPAHIVGEVSLLIRHQLLSLSTSLDAIKVVLAHPQALAQCQSWLSKNLPHAERRPVSSNAEGARLAASNPTWAGISSARAATQFGLHTVAPAIQDDPYNRTRFAIICLPQTLGVAPPSAKDCTSLIVSVPNQPGAVHDLLVPLKTYGVSMTRFESRPARTAQWEYYFYIDIDGHPSLPHVQAALQELRKLCAFYKVLGTYPSGS